ncbi:MAG TPA: hypothetical protein VGA70_09950 [Longimicrobiales bacterium]
MAPLHGPARRVTDRVYDRVLEGETRLPGGEAAVLLVRARAAEDGATPPEVVLAQEAERVPPWEGRWPGHWGWRSFWSSAE